MEYARKMMRRIVQETHVFQFCLGYNRYEILVTGPFCAFRFSRLSILMLALEDPWYRNPLSQTKIAADDILIFLLLSFEENQA